MAMPIWISECQVFGTMIIGSGIAGLALQQYRIAKRKLKLDLYEKRWSVFNAMRNYLTITYGDKEKLQEAVLKAYEKKAEARFLLDKKACSYIEEFVKVITGFNNINVLLSSGQMDGSPREAMDLRISQGNRTQWIMQQYEPLVNEFERFLNVDHNL